MLCVMTCYFNPSGYRSKLDNYRIFRRYLTARLLCVELSFTGEFDLTPSDADTLIQIRGEAVLWQKERLLNVALGALPASCRSVAWIDCDVLFEHGDWIDRASDALRTHDVIQLFHLRCNLARAAPSDPPGLDRIDSQAVSLGYKVAAGTATPDDVRLSDAPLTLGSTAGLAWAARRDILAERGLYDACILGTADRVMAAAAMGRPDLGRDALLMNDTQWVHYVRWAEPFHHAVRGKVGYIEGRAFHLWHGALRNRRYHDRHAGLRPYAFDPFTDIAVSSDGCWRWNSDKPGMHAYVRTYFEERDEDGLSGS